MSNETESSTKGKIDDETESSTKVSDSSKGKMDDEIKSSTKVSDSIKGKMDDETESSTKVSDSIKGKMDDETESSTKVSDSNKEKIDDDTEPSTKVMVGNKRKRRDDGELDDTASTGSAKIKKFFNDLSDYEDEIMRRILSYNIDLKESNCNVLVAERLRSDDLHAHVCTTEWEAIRLKGRKTYTVTHSFIEIMKKRGNEAGEEEKLIVDLDFQSQFTFAMATARYRELWSYLPNIFIGTEEKLTRIITIITTAAGKRIAAWIKPDFLHSKWLSPNRKIQQ